MTLRFVRVGLAGKDKGKRIIPTVHFKKGFRKVRGYADKAAVVAAVDLCGWTFGCAVKSATATAAPREADLKERR
jgi:hypothetical protein